MTVPGPGSPGTRPARSYVWPSFQAGHELTLKHGAYSPRVVDPMAEERVGEILQLAYQNREWAYLADAGYRDRLWSYARALAREELFHEDCGKNGVFDQEGNPRPSNAEQARWATIVDNKAAKLGLDPTSHARLLRDLAASADSAASVGVMLERLRASVAADTAAEDAEGDDDHGVFHETDGAPGDAAMP